MTTTDKKALQETIKNYVKENLATYQDNALKIHAKPETSNHEYYAQEILTDQLEKEGFTVKKDVAGHPTGFDARYKSDKEGPTLVYLAEFDALPDIGHGCGHNLFGNYSSLAAAALKQVVDQVGGEIRVYGTPGEEGGENGSAKESFVREGFLDDVDAALCVHPGGDTSPSGHLYANDPVDIEFFGKSAHATANPEDGISALEPLILTFNGIDALRLHLHDDVSIHGVILDGGKAANVIPDYCRGRFYIRAYNRHTLDQVREKVKRIAEGAAHATGAELKFGLFQNKVDDMIITPSFDDVFFSHADEVGLDLDTVKEADSQAHGSSDVGNISYVVPTIQPFLAISEEPVPGHSKALVAAAKSAKGLDSIRIAATLLALTGLDLILDPDKLAQIKEDHQAALAKGN
ncbi:M20 family metallopeptidase [Aerococcus urinae]|uniref:Peptidase M20 domain-containing protein 2 n=1 Tax=Aerococcus urinae TaxID=1376 RepID=A0A120I9V0_9LACT|nr:M20 family metallopeptidase [Aerococcus urinae]AMB96056.1 amidohydrolase [Aerococcus urinae]MCY3033364.1 M20 family metallopeptidase [Aerococcus urinae]MCY3038556.1 M20 family metallopeptidase [Aerococcus urinae]MCY3045330.1 M20 family metallopeptidase [Aerococcus urinae]MCY3047062.1 M20 family metallopeptidase [Aerococcus urinae]